MSKKAVRKQAAPASAPVVRTRFFEPDFWQTQRLPVLILMALSFALYGISIGFGYLQDDQIYIWDNIFVQKGFAGLAQIFGNDSLLGYYKDPKLMLEGGRYRPLPLASFAMEIGLFGKNSPWAGHFFNVLYYGLCGVLVYRVLYALLPRQENTAWYFSLPFAATMLYMAHPTHVEVVANIKSRDEIFAMMGSMGALWAMMKYFDTQATKWQWRAGGLFLLGLLSKENTATFLAIIPLSIMAFSGVSLRRALAACWPMFAAALLFMGMRAMALSALAPHTDEMVLNPFLGMTFGEKLATKIMVLGWYLKLLFAPWPLTIDYYPFHVPKGNWSDWRVLVSLAAYAAAGFWAWKQFRRQKAENEHQIIPAYSIAYFVAAISVVSNIVVSTSTFMSERYLFMPSLAACLFLAWAAIKLLPQALKQPEGSVNMAGAGLLGVVFAVFSWLTLMRVPDWSGDGARLVTSAIQVSGDSYRANYYYANLLYDTRYKPLEKATDPASMASKQKLLDSIGYYIDKSLSINPGYRLAAPLQVQLAVGRYNQDKNLDKLLKTFEALIQGQPTNGEMLTMVLDVLKSLKGSDPNIYNFFCHRVGYSFYFRKMQDPEGGIQFLNLGLANYPQDGNTMQDLMEIYSSMGNQSKVMELQQRLRSGGQ